jgi:hypothetical protein
MCGVETSQNNMDSHIECSPTRLAADDRDLMELMTRLKKENIFLPSQPQFRKLLSGKIVHSDIIDNICTLFERGEQAMSAFIEDRLINKTVAIDEPLKAMFLLSK